jgi:predicted Zn-dependent protease
MMKSHYHKPMNLQNSIRRNLFAITLVTASLGSCFVSPAQAQPAGLPSIGSVSSSELSPAWEQRLGDSIIAQGRRDPTFVHDAELNQYLNDMGHHLAQHVQGGAPRIEVFAVRDSAFNAFAMPGGYIGINTGLIVQSDSESELAGVMAHEIAHVSQRHIARGLTQSQQSNTIAMASVAAALLAALAGGVDLAAGISAFGQAAAIDQQLGFSRSAEREADRVGFQMLNQSGYDPNGLQDMFAKLMQASQMNVSRAGATYLSTHPLSIDRMTDMQNRTQLASRSRVPSSDAFWYMRAKSMVLQATSRQALTRVVDRLQNDGQQLKGAPRSAAWLALADLAMQREQFEDAQRFLDYAKQGVSNNPYLARLAVALTLARGQSSQALTLADQGLSRWPNQRSLVELKAQALEKLGRHAQAAKFLDPYTKKWPNEAPRLFEMKAQYLMAANQPIAARVAMADYYVLTGAFPAAMAQLQQARALSDSFHEKSKLDVTIRALSKRMDEEREVLERFNG